MEEYPSEKYTLVFGETRELLKPVPIEVRVERHEVETVVVVEVVEEEDPPRTWELTSEGN